MSVLLRGHRLTPVAALAGAGAPPAFQLLPSYVAAAIVKAEANTAQWVAFKAVLDANLSVAQDQLTGYQGGGLSRAADYALGYRCLKTSDPTTAATYAQKAVGLLRAGTNSSIHGYDTGKIYLGRGNGVTTTFTIPAATVNLATLKVYINDVATATVTKGAANGADFFYAYGKPLKVSNTSDGTADYAETTDWKTTLSLYPGKTVGGTDSNFGYRLIDWSPGGTEPSVAATYYVTYAYILDGYSLKTIVTDYTAAGTTVTFGTAPASDKAVWAEYQYSVTEDAHTLAYQQSYNGLGGDSEGFTDSGYTARNLKHLVIAADWLWDYASFGATLKAAVLAQFNSWSDYWTNYGYSYHSPLNNYGAGYVAARAWVALCAVGRDVTNEARLKSEVLAFRTTYLDPALIAPDTSVLLNGTLFDGYYPDGWNYGPQATLNLLIGELAVEQAGWATIAPARTAAADFVTTLLTEEMYHGGASGPNYRDPEGDGYTYPAILALTDLWYVLAEMTANSTTKSYINYLIQHYPSFDGSSWSAAPNNQVGGWADLCLRDPTATASSGFTSALPIARHVRGMGLVYARKDYAYNSTWMAFHCGDLAASGHQPFNQGELQLWRGTDDLLVRPTAVTLDQTFQNESHYANLVLIDDAGAGYMLYPSTGGGPAQATQYGGPDHHVTLDHYELGSGSAYVYCQGDYAEAYYYSSGIGLPATELVRSILYIPGSDYVFVQDRVTTAVDTFTKALRWFANPSATVSRSTNAWTIARGASKLFGKTFSDVALTSTNGVEAAQGNCKYIETNNTSATTKVRYRTALQSAASGVSAMDTVADIASTDTFSEGILLGQVAAIFGVDGALNVGTDLSYTATWPSGTTTHYVSDLVPGTVYTLGGIAAGSATASAEGVAVFTTATSGSHAVTLTDSNTPTFTVTVTDPDGGESLTGGDTFSITWTHTGTIDHYKILLSTDSGSTYPTTVTLSDAASPYSWSVNNITTSTARIKVQALDGSNVVLASDESAADFSITAAATPTKPASGTAVATNALTSGATAIYGFLEGVGSTTAESVSGTNTGTLSGGVTWASDVSGPYLANDGTGKVSLTSVIQLATGFGTGAWTVAWRATSTGGATDTSTIWGRNADADYLVMLPGSYVRLHTATGDNADFALTSFAADDDYMLVADGATNVSLYKNGVLVSTATGKDTRFQLQGLSGDDGSKHQTGRLDYVYIWGARALDVADAVALHADPYGTIFV